MRKKKISEEQIHKEEMKTKAQVLLVTCVDFRLRHHIDNYMATRGFIENYDEITLPGASLGVMNDIYPHWEKAFLEQFHLLRKIHHFDHVLFMDHRDCGMYRLVLGEEHLDSIEAETLCHRDQVKSVIKHLFLHMPDLSVEGVIMNLDGSVESLVRVS